jgi:hypothetical protein
MIFRKPSTKPGMAFMSINSTAGLKPVAPLAYRINAAASASGLCRSQLYALMRAGTLPYVEVGKVRMIRAADLRQLLGIVEESK